jgi:hypothetical protein
MARIRQQYPQNYGSSGNISTEFENVIRYLNAAELGNKTVGELLAQIFDENGDFDGPIEIRKDTAGGIQYRVGNWDTADEGWTTIVTLSDIRGEPGADLGWVGAPIFHSRADYVATAAQAIFSYAHAASDELMVFVNGVLKRRSTATTYDYTSDPAASTVTLSAALGAGDKVTIYKVRTNAITGYRRQDYYTTGNQTVFGFGFDADTQLQVYKNGILQREGGSYDYTLQPDNDTVTFNVAVPINNLVSIIVIENRSSQAITGLMLENNFCDIATGLIKLAKISIADNAIAQAKVSGLVTALGTTAKMTVSASTPTTPTTGSLWLDTSQTPNQLKFYNGTAWLRTSVENAIPTFSSSNAGQYVRVNGTGTNLEYAGVDLSSVIPLTSRGAANGVASLDSSGRLPSAQLPSALSSFSYYSTVASPSNTNYTITRIFKQKITLEGIAVRVTGGSCTLQVMVGGVATGITYSVSVTPTEISIASPIEIDATTASKTIGFVVTNVSSATVLDIVISGSILTS